MPDARTMRSRAEARREVQLLRAEAVEVAKLHSEQAARVREVAKAHWPSWLVTAVTSVVSVIIGLMAGWFGLQGTQFGAEEDRAKESREKRSQIHADYLAAARSYLQARGASSAIDKAYEAAERVIEVTTREKAPAKWIADARRKTERMAAAQEKAAEREEPARIAFEKQVDLIYVYGSDEAWRGAPCHHASSRWRVRRCWR